MKITNPDGGPLTWPQIEAAREQIEGKWCRLLYSAAVIEGVVACASKACYVGRGSSQVASTRNCDNPLSIEVLDAPEAGGYKWETGGKYVREGSLQCKSPCGKYCLTSSTSGCWYVSTTNAPGWASGGDEILAQGEMRLVDEAPVLEEGQRAAEAAYERIVAEREQAKPAPSPYEWGIDNICTPSDGHVLRVEHAGFKSDLWLWTIECDGDVVDFALEAGEENARRAAEEAHATLVGKGEAAAVDKPALPEIGRRVEVFQASGHRQWGVTKPIPDCFTPDTLFCIDDDQACTIGFAADTFKSWRYLDAQPAPESERTLSAKDGVVVKAEDKPAPWAPPQVGQRFTTPSQSVLRGPVERIYGGISSGDMPALHYAPPLRYEDWQTDNTFVPDGFAWEPVADERDEKLADAYKRIEELQAMKTPPLGPNQGTFIRQNDELTTAILGREQHTPDDTHEAVVALARNHREAAGRAPRFKRGDRVYLKGGGSRVVTGTHSMYRIEAHDGAATHCSEESIQSLADRAAELEAEVARLRASGSGKEEDK